MDKKFRIPVIFTVIVFYLVYHIMHGNRSVFVYLEKQERLQKSINEMGDLKKQNLTLENKISRIRDDNLDIDLLEEEARKILGRSEPKEVVLIN